MRIHVVTPVITAGLSTAEDFAWLTHEGLEITQEDIENGPSTIESAFDEALAVPDTLRKAAEAVSSGADAVVVDCMTDPGLSAIREATGALVMGPAQSAFHVASLLALNFSIITASRDVLPTMAHLVAQYGLRDAVCSMRSVDIPVHELTDADRLGEALVDEAMAAVVHDGAHAIVLGCTGMMGWANRIEEHLAHHGHPGIPVIDPVVAAVTLSEALTRMGLTPSRRTYARPLAKRTRGYDAVVSAVSFATDDR